VSRARKATAVLLSVGLLPALSWQRAAPSLDGIWQSDGYGLLIDIQGSQLSSSQVTSISCVPWWTAQRVERDVSNGEVVFNRGDAEVRVTRGSSPDALWMREGVSISRIKLHRISAQPENCRRTWENTPITNYAVFWQTFAEQFALFPVYRTDWAAVDRKYRPQVTPSTTPEELFAILREMILPFHNAHTNINAASIHRQYLGYRPVSEIGRTLQQTSALSISEILGLFNREAQRSKQIVESNYMDDRLRSYANDVIHFGILKGSIGYLRIVAFDGYTKSGVFSEETSVLDAALDDVLTDAGRMKGLIIDVRVNTGGADPLCLAIASRLTDAKYLAYSKVTRNNLAGPLRLTEPQSAWVDVSDRPRYLGKVVVLIGPETISGGETFAMALLGRRPRTVFIGENTQGVFSDVWGRKLPNGWTFGVPTELYLTKAGKSFDARGVPPDIRVPVFPGSDLESGRDGALERAIQLLSGTRTPGAGAD
jgi:peptidase S41-like protein/tricorn protease-like protein